MYSKEELKTLDRIAEETYGCRFEELDFDDQDDIYCYAEENGLM